MATGRLRRRVRLAFQRVGRFVEYRVLHVDDTPHRIALGMAIGMFSMLLPCIGFQSILVLAFATVLRANKVVGLPLVWISNPATIIPIYYPSYLLGVAITPGVHGETLHGWERMVEEVFNAHLGWWDRVAGFWHFALQVAVPLWVGCAVVGLVIGALTYWLTYVAVIRYRRRLAHWRERRHPSEPVDAAAGSGDPPSQPSRL